METSKNRQINFNKNTLTEKWKIILRVHMNPHIRCVQMDNNYLWYEPQNHYIFHSSWLFGGKRKMIFYCLPISISNWRILFDKYTKEANLCIYNFEFYIFFLSGIFNLKMNKKLAQSYNW